MIKLGILLIVENHDYAPKVFKKLLSKLIDFSFYNFSNYKKILKNYFLYILFLLNILFQKYYRFLKISIDT
jgi:hypothetical protein